MSDTCVIMTWHWITAATRHVSHNNTSILFPRLTNFTCPGATSAWPPDWNTIKCWMVPFFLMSSHHKNYLFLHEKIGFTLNWKVTEWVPKFASNWVLILTAGGFPVAFWTTRNSFVTISMTWPVWKTKSPFLTTAWEDRHPGTLGWLFNSRVGEDWRIHNFNQ